MWVSTPSKLHKPVVHMAVRAGKHVFCEKPLDEDPAEILQAFDLADQYGVKIMVGFQRRYSNPKPKTEREREREREGE